MIPAHKQHVNEMQAAGEEQRQRRDEGKKG